MIRSSNQALHYFCKAKGEIGLAESYQIARWFKNNKEAVSKGQLFCTLKNTNLDMNSWQFKGYKKVRRIHMQEETKDEYLARLRKEQGRTDSTELNAEEEPRAEAVTFVSRLKRWFLLLLFALFIWAIYMIFGMLKSN